MREKYRIIKDSKSIGTDSYRIQSEIRSIFGKRWVNIHPSLTFPNIIQSVDFLLEIKKDSQKSPGIYLNYN